MAMIHAVGTVGGAGPAGGPAPSGGGRFAELLEGPAKPPGVPVTAAEGAAPRSVAEVPRGACEARGVERTSGSGPVTGARESQAVQMLDRVGEAQRRLDHVLALAESGRSFSPAELIALQAHVYRASQELDLAGKVVEKALGGVKQVLQTQV